MRSAYKIGGLAAAFLALGAIPAGAQEAVGGTVTVEEFDAFASTMTVVWVGLAAGLVFLMQAGFTMVEAGLTRSKNSANIVAKNLADMIIGALAYWAIGAAFAYGLTTKGGFMGWGGFFFESGNPESALGGDAVQFLFQLVFAATAATIVSGAVAERMKFTGYLVVSLFITGLIYPIVSHWQWFGQGGWLFDRGYYDFAGSSLVHMTGGVAALVGAAIVGPRIGKYGKDGKPRAIPGHSIPMAMTGVFILWFGWFGFNGGSTLGIGNREGGFLGDGIGGIGHILTTTTLAAAAGGLAAAAAIWAIARKPDPAMAGNGALAGLVVITAAPDMASTLNAVLVGLIAGVVVVLSVMAIDRIRIDDPVGAISVHGVCGMLGTLAVPFYAHTPDSVTLGTQALGVAAIAGFVGVTAGAVFLAVKYTVGLRVSEEVEIAGLDLHEHGIAGYADLSFGPSSASSRVPVAAGQVRVGAPVTDG